MRLRVDKYTRIGIFIIVASFIALCFLCVYFPGLNHGDTWDDAASLNAGSNFVKFGFIKCRFLAVRGFQLSSPEGHFYTHVPPFSDIFNAALRILFQTNSLILFRIVSLLFSVFSIWFWFLVIRKILSPQIGVLFIIFYITNPYFIELSDSLHHYVYSDFLLPLILYVFIAYLDSTNKNRIYFWFLPMLLFTQMFVSFEYVIFSYLFMLGYCLLFDKKASFNDWLILIFASVLGFTAHLLQNAWALGSVRIAINDLFSAFLRRVGGLQAEEPIAALSLSGFIGMLKRNFMLVKFDSWLIVLLWFIIIYYQFILAKKKSGVGLLKKYELLNLKHLKLPFLLFICGISWWFVFPSYNCVHPFPARHIIPALALSLGVCFYAVLSIIKCINSRHIRLLVYFLCITFIIFINLYYINDLIFKRIRKIENTYFFLNDNNFISTIQRHISPNKCVYVNWWNNMLLSYCVDRNFIWATSFKDIAENKNKAGAFLYLKDNNKALLNFLKNRYSLISSGRFYQIFDLGRR